MAHLKLKICTKPSSNPEFKYKRNIGYREAYIDQNEQGELVVKEKSSKWKVISRKEPSVIKDTTKLMEGLVFKNHDDVNKFLEQNKSSLDKISKENPTFECFKPVKIINRFKPADNKLKVWSSNK